MNPKLTILFCLFLTFILQACMQNEANVNLPNKKYVIQNDPTQAKNNFLFLHTASYQQTTGYTCGPAVVMSLLNYYGMLKRSDMNKITEMRIAQEMGTTMQGTSQEAMVNWLKQHGFTVDYGQTVTADILIDNLKRSVPTIIIWNDWSGHAMLVVGYYASKNKMFFVDPSTRSSLVANKQNIAGIDTISPRDLELNWFDARHTFNPTRTAAGMYIVAVPKR